MFTGAGVRLIRGSDPERFAVLRIRLGLEFHKGQYVDREDDPVRRIPGRLAELQLLPPVIERLMRDARKVPID